MNRYSGRDTVLHAGTYFVPFVAFMLVSALYSESSYPRSLLDLGLLWLIGLGFSYAAIIVHELGHVIAARAVGIEITHITIGHWRKLVSFPIGATTFTLRAAPASGYVVPKLSVSLLSAPRVIPFLLAGVIAQGIVIGLITLFPRPTTITSFNDLLHAYIYVDIVIIGGFHALTNLWPFEGWVGGEKLPSDGMLLLRLWKDRHQKPAQRQLISEFQKLTVLCESRDFSAALRLTEQMAKDNPANLELLRLGGMLQMECGNLDKAETIWRDLLKQPIGTSAFAASVFDALCCLPLYYGRKDLLGEAEAWANTAIRCAPSAITLKGTHGSILIELGRIDEGIKVLRDVAKRSECQIDQVISAAYLSKAFRLTGDHAEAKQWMDKAREINSGHAVVKRLEREQSSTAIQSPTAHEHLSMIEQDLKK